MPSSSSTVSIQSDFAAARAALEEIAAAGGTTRLALDKDGGARLIISLNKNKKKNDDSDSDDDDDIDSGNVKDRAAENDKNKNTNVVDTEEINAIIQRNEQFLTPLMRAARAKNGDEVQRKISEFKKKCDKDSKETFGQFLNEVEKEDYGEHEVKDEEKAAEKESEVVRGSKCGVHGEKKVDKNEQTGGWAAIHFACDYGNHEGLQYLLEAGADPNLTERMGATPLHRVILAAGKYPLQQLLSGGDMSGGIGGDGRGKGGGQAVPGVVCSKSSIKGKDGDGKGSSTKKKSSTSDVKLDSYLESYTKCAKLLLDHGRFNLMMNERREDEYNASKPASSSFGSGSTKNSGKKNVRNLKNLPQNDGFGISPTCLCVCSAYSARDALYPLLEILLTRGFDPNGTMSGVSALHIALRNAHYGCAFALTRAGANIHAVHPDDGKTALKTAEIIFGESFARELREASVVALAVADPTRRRDMLRSQGSDGGKKLAKRAMNAGHSFIKASRWREAAGAYTEAASYGPNCLGMPERFECLRNMSECFLQVERGMKAEEIARKLLKEFPKVPLAMVAVGEAMSHPSCGKLSPEQLKEVSKLAEDALKIQKKSDGKEWWRALEPANQNNSTLLRTLKLKGLVDGKTQEKNPAVKVANTALDEYFSIGGSIEKAAFAIELALKPALNHPSPLPLHGIKGFIYYSWASEILRANSLCRSDRERKEGLLRVMAPLKDKSSYKEASEKIQIAFDEFEYYQKMNVNGEFPKLMYGFNISKTNFARGNFSEGKIRALASIKERAEADLVRLNGDSTRRRSATEVAQDDHFEGGSTQKLILQLNWALDLNRMLVSQMVIDWAINADSTKPSLPPSQMLLESSIKGLTLNDNAINSQHLSLILDRAKELKMLDKTSEKKFIEQISGDPIKINSAIRGLLCAMKTIEAGHMVMNELRVEVGKVIMKFVTGAHRKQKETKSSSRVIGSLLVEALEWDKNVKIPKSLPSIYLKMAQEFTQGGSSGK